MWSTRSRETFRAALRAAQSISLLRTTVKSETSISEVCWLLHGQARRVISSSLGGRQTRATTHCQRGLSSSRREFDRSLTTSTSILKPLAFCAASSAAVFTYAAYSEEETHRLAWARLRSSAPFGLRRRDEPQWLQHMPAVVQNLYREFWLDTSPARRVVGAIMAVNVGIFAAFRGLPSLRGPMVTNFIHALPPFPFKARTLLTSNFMHQNPMHLAVNMLAFWSFGTEAARSLGAEQFGAFYISAGLASGLLSHLGRIRSATGGFSLGASGAVYACFAVAALARPDTEVVLIFLPFLPINIMDAFSVLVAVDTAGALLGWRRFDHLGHLGGALFGWCYARYGQHDIWPRFQRLAEKLQDSKP